MEADIYHALVEAGKIRWITGRGYLSKPWYPLVMVEGKQLRSFNAPTVDPSRKRLLTAAEATDLVLPDVAWMSDPWPREKFTGWITETCNE